MEKMDRFVVLGQLSGPGFAARRALCSSAFSLLVFIFTACKQKVESKAFCSKGWEKADRQEMKLEPGLAFIFCSPVSCSPPAPSLVFVSLSLTIWGVCVGFDSPGLDAALPS